VADPDRGALAGRAGVVGPWGSVYGLFRRWQRDGAWARILTALQARADAAGLIPWDVAVDSTIARAHQQAAGARMLPKPSEAWAIGSIREPTEAAAPPDEPPEIRLVSHGLRVGPYSRGSQVSDRPRKAMLELSVRSIGSTNRLRPATPVFCEAIVPSEPRVRTAMSPGRMIGT